ncbi:hypothetical protein AXF42_Ash020963 [Apostasia shenzhenica]|uniref:Uncharacterized protein n=1 Tax=Apostasia shenzhenica TaxID=1088818 RepID=A0A2H9ZYM0_9ASPA|nr:hypothetical protein AXF42_Ash020963 [Apostasia shenzhenica]
MDWHKEGLKGYWKRITYRSLDGNGAEGARKGRRSKIQLGGGGGSRRRRFWGIKVSPRLRFLRAVSPKRILKRIRDAYVRMMLGLANSSALTGHCGDPFPGFKAAPMKEYDERMILQIYKSLMSQGHIFATSGISLPPAPPPARPASGDRYLWLNFDAETACRDQRFHFFGVVF